jgi:DNA helicase TIP49 (TBP-interacting protein)
MKELMIAQLNKEREEKAILCEIVGSTLFDADLVQTSFLAQEMRKSYRLSYLTI